MMNQVMRPRLRHGEKEHAKSTLPPPLGRLRIIPLGGVGEVGIGKNMMAYEFGRDIIVVDCGLLFAGQEYLGVDFIIPDVRYLEERKDRIRAIILTHGHEDHIGGVPYIWPRLGHPPMYGTALTAAFLEAKLEELGVRGKVNRIKPGDFLQFGAFRVETFPVSHTIVDDFGLAIGTPAGLFLHISDFKVEYSEGKAESFFKIMEMYGKRDVTCLLLESTNAEEEGLSVSEKVVAGTVDELVKDAPGRVIATSFASNLDRMQMVIEASARYGRKVAVSGRSLERNLAIASKLGYLRVPQGILVDIGKTTRMRDREITILAAGSQGEEFSALTRIASGEHRHIKIKPGDLVIMSVSTVPGNERAVANVIDNLFREGARVYYGGEAARLHASGHAKAGDLKKVIEFTRPRYFIPIHGEYRMLMANARLAEEVGVPAAGILAIENGEVVEFDGKVGKKIDAKAPSGNVLVDGLGIGDVGAIVLRDRQAMAKEGVFMVILTVGQRTGELITSPDIISRGFVYMRASEELIGEAREKVKEVFLSHTKNRPINWEFVKQSLRDELGEFLFKKTERRPMVIPVVIQV
jgi:ribonuclease J